jgi:ketosteroid isomerase-like protein
MSQENVEIVRAHATAYEKGDWERTLAGLDSDVVLDFSARPDGSVCRGREEVVAMTRAWLGTWRDYHYETEDVIDAGDQVLLLFREGGRGKKSDVTVEHRGGWIYTLRDGKIVHGRVYSRAEALEAGGLSEDDVHSSS